MELATRKLSRTLAISSTTNRVPLISLLSPDNVTAGGAGFTLTVTGSGFVPGSVVRWNGSNRTTTFVSSTELEAEILAADIAREGTVEVTVFNPAPGGGLSNAVGRPPCLPLLGKKRVRLLKNCGKTRFGPLSPSLTH